jgi:hypothetical protein
MPGCDTERLLKCVIDPFEMRFQPLIDDIKNQKEAMEGPHAQMVLHGNIRVLCAQCSGKLYPLPLAASL